MRKPLLTMMIGAQLLLGALVGPAAAVGAPMFDWDPAFFWQPGGTPSNLPLNGQMNIVGIISLFGPPFEDLNPTLATTEYTFYAHNLVSNGTTVQGGALQIYTTTYSGGTIEIYSDNALNASFDPNPPNPGVPADFIDGALFLAGSFNSFTIQTNNFTANQTGNAEGVITWTGGPALARLNQGHDPCPGLFTGGLTWNTSVGIPGYLFRHDGKLDNNCPTPTRNSTWGTIKQLYR